MRGGCYSGIIDIKRQIHVRVNVALPGFWQSGGSHYFGIPPVAVNALIDTGANISCITPDVAKMLNIPSMYKKPVISSDGKFQKGIYNIDMRIFLSPQADMPEIQDFKQFSRVDVAIFHGISTANMLLGMDIIMQGSLEIKRNNFTFCL